MLQCVKGAWNITKTMKQYKPWVFTETTFHMDFHQRPQYESVLHEFVKPGDQHIQRKRDAESTEDPLEKQQEIKKGLTDNVGAAAVTEMQSLQGFAKTTSMIQL